MLLIIAQFTVQNHSFGKVDIVIENGYGRLFLPVQPLGLINMNIDLGLLEDISVRSEVCSQFFFFS